jgi:hypothetical protein
LHIGIMSAMLGKQVLFSDNSYGKNADVFVHSMCGRFSNVQWCADASLADSPMLSSAD